MCFRSNPELQHPSMKNGFGSGTFKKEMWGIKSFLLFTAFYNRQWDWKLSVHDGRNIFGDIPATEPPVFLWFTFYPCTKFFSSEENNSISGSPWSFNFLSMHLVLVRLLSLAPSDKNYSLPITQTSNEGLHELHIGWGYHQPTALKWKSILTYGIFIYTNDEFCLLDNVISPAMPFPLWNDCRIKLGSLYFVAYFNPLRGKELFFLKILKWLINTKI